MTRIRSALALSLVLVGCGGEEPAGSTLATGTTCPPGGTAVRWADLDLELFGDAAGTTGYCNYCHHSSRTTNDARHGAPPFARLDLLADVQALAARIDAVAGKGPTPTTPVMPFILPPPRPADVPDPQPVPTDPERISLSVWLACGAPQ